MNKYKETDVYKTSDLFLASILLTKGAEFIEFEKTTGIKKQIVFVMGIANIDLMKIINDFQNGNVTGNISDFIREFKALRSSMFIALNEG